MGPGLRRDDGLESSGEVDVTRFATLKTVIPTKVGTHAEQLKT
jgi:hypothetical protein